MIPELLPEGNSIIEDIDIYMEQLTSLIQNGKSQNSKQDRHLKQLEDRLHTGLSFNRLFSNRLASNLKDNTSEGVALAKEAALREFYNQATA